MTPEAEESASGSRIRAVETTGVMVPLTFALGTSAAVVRAAPLVLVDLHADDGIVGRAYVFAYTPAGARAIAALIREAVGLVVGQRAAPRTIGALLQRRYALLGVTGALRMALSAIDVALWDVQAIGRGVSLARLLGAEPRPIRAYNSSGLGLMAPDAAADEAEKLLARGFTAVKLRLGYPSLAEDLATLRAVRRRLPDSVAIMADYNQALTTAAAVARGRALDAEGLCWLEEPIRHDDLAGNAAIARAIATPLQIGENFNGPAELAEALAAAAGDYVMPDLARIGGVSGWIDAAGIAAAHGVEMSSHLFPEVSAHLLAATATAHWLEYVDWADAILERPLRIVDGHAVLDDKPGNGLVWDVAKLSRLERIA